MKEIEIHFKGGDGKRIKTLPEVPDNSDYVDLLTNQDIDGKKNFIQTPTINGKDITTQEKLDELSNSKQNTLTAGAGISIENDTISVTDVGGLTVLPYGTLDADTLAKVKANPQNYCIKSDSLLYYFVSESSTYYLYRTAKVETTIAGTSTELIQQGMEISKSTGVMSSNWNDFINFSGGTTKKKTNNLLTVVGIEDTTDNTIKTGTEIRKAITIRKWH